MGDGREDPNDGLGLGTPSSSSSIGTMLYYVGWDVLLGTVVLAIAIINGKLDAVLGIQDEKREEKDVKDRGGKEKVEEWKVDKEKITPLPNPKNL